MITSRRAFLLGSTALLAAPAIVRATSLMPVKAIEPLIFPLQCEERFAFTLCDPRAFFGSAALKIEGMPTLYDAGHINSWN